MAVAANKSDLYEFEEVPEQEGMAFAKQINAIFQTTTAKDSNGSIDLLFKNIGKRFLNPNMQNNEDDNQNKKGQELKKGDNSKPNKKKCC